MLLRRYDEELAAFAVNLPCSSVGASSGAQQPAAAPSGEADPPAEFYLDPATVRRADTSAASINEWTGERMSRDADVPDDVRPASVGPLGNYAVRAVSWALSARAQAC